MERKRKTYAGSQALAALVFLQTASIPQFINSPETLRFATYGLFVFEIFLSLLMFIPVFCTRQVDHALPGRRREVNSPRLLTMTNLLTALLLAVSAWAAWRAEYWFTLMLAGAVLLLTPTVLLHWRNLRHWKNSVQNTDSVT